MEREVTFVVQPENAQVSIENHFGQTDIYPVQKKKWVKFPSAAFTLKISAPGWKSQEIPVNTNQFRDRWPVTGTWQLEPDSWQAHLWSLPRWPLLFLGVPALLFFRRKPLPVVVPNVVSQEPSLPWELAVGQKVGEHEVVQRLGEGVSAVVYRVKGGEGDLALKLLKPQHFRQGDVLPRFRREMKALCRLRHAHIPYLADFGEYQGMNYLAMELLSPSSLLDTLEKGPMRPAEALVVLRHLTEALEFCHKQGILHRDIKPENVVWGRDGKVRLTDFGLARPHDASTLTVEGTLLGTPAYMAPELVQGEPTSAVTDIYSLGCLAYHMLAGRPPFEAESPLAVLMQHISNQPAELPSDCPDQLRAWVDRCMQKAPEDRFADMSVALRELPATS